MTAMVSERWSVHSTTGHHIRGVTHYQPGAGDRSRAVIQVHGLTGSMDEHIQQMAAAHLAAEGYDVLRFNLQAQDFLLRHATLQTHAADLRAVIEQQTSAYGKLFVIGHSYGGPTVMAAQPIEAAAICLWDPSFDLPALWARMGITDIGDIGLLNFGGVEVVVGQAMVVEGRGDDFSAAACLALSTRFGKPIKVISAASGDEFDVYQANPQSWHSAGHDQNCRVLIPNSDHCFTASETLNQLLQETAQWFAVY